MKIKTHDPPIHLPIQREQQFVKVASSAQTERSKIQSLAPARLSSASNPSAQTVPCATPKLVNAPPPLPLLLPQSRLLLRRRRRRLSQRYVSSRYVRMDLLVTRILAAAPRQGLRNQYALIRVRARGGKLGIRLRATVLQLGGR